MTTITKTMVAVDGRNRGNRTDGQVEAYVAFPSAIAWRSLDGDVWETVHLAVPEGADGSTVGGVMQTPAGLAFLGTAQVGDTESIPVLWLEP